MSEAQRMSGRKVKGFPCLTNTRKAVRPSFNVTQRLRMRELRGCLQPTRQTYPVCRSLFGKIPGRLGIPLKAIIDDRFLTEEGHVFLGFSKDGNFVLSYTLNVDTDEHTAFPVYLYQLHWWRFNHYQAMEKVSEVGLFGEEEIQQDLYIAICSWPSDSTKVMVYGCNTSSKPLGDEEKLLCYVTITAVPSTEPCPNCLHLKYTSDMATGFSSGFNPGWLPPEFQEDLPTPAAPTCLKHGFAVHTKYELAPPFPSFSPKHSLSKDGVTVLNTGYSIIALAVSLGKGSPCSSLYSPGNSSARSFATRASDVGSMRGGGSRCRDWLHSSSNNSQGFAPGDERNTSGSSSDRRHDISTVPIYSQSSTAITDFCNFGLDEESSDSEDLLLGIRLASGLQAPQSTSPSVISSRDFLDILDEEECEGADLCEFAKQTKVLQGHSGRSPFSPTAQETTSKTLDPSATQETDCDSTSSADIDATDGSRLPKTPVPLKDSTHSKASDSTSVRLSITPNALNRTLVASPEQEASSSERHVPSIDHTKAVQSKCASIPSEICITLTSSSTTPIPKLGNPNPLQGSPRHISHSYSLDPESRYHHQIPDSSSKHMAGLYEAHLGCHGLSPRSLESDDFSPPTSNCPTPSRWNQTPVFHRHSRLPCDNWSTCSSISFHRLNDVNDKDDIGSEIDHNCPYHHGHFDHYSQGSGRSTIRECTCKLQRFTYSVRRFVERYFPLEEPIDSDSFEYHSMLPLTVVGSNNMRMLLANRSLPQEGPFVEVKQLTMDAEHYMCEAIRTVAPWGRRYIAFTDYDMQVLDVCADSCNVVVMIKCLVRAWPEPNKPKDVFEFEDETANETPQMYQTGFKFAWNLKTGQYQTFEVESLQEFDQAQLCKVWNPGRALCQRIQRRWAIPQAHTKGVHVLTNEAVFKNRSLTKLLDPLHYVAIVLT